MQVGMNVNFVSTPFPRKTKLLISNKSVLSNKRITFWHLVKEFKLNIVVIVSLQDECWVTVPCHVTLPVTVADFCLQIECRWENNAAMLRGVGKYGAAHVMKVHHTSAVQVAARFSLTLAPNNNHMASRLMKPPVIGCTLVAASCCVWELNQSVPLISLYRQFSNSLDSVKCFPLKTKYVKNFTVISTAKDKTIFIHKCTK